MATKLFPITAEEWSKLTADLPRKKLSDEQREQVRASNERVANGVMFLSSDERNSARAR